MSTSIEPPPDAPGEQELLASPNPSPPDPPPSPHGADQADPITLVRDGGESAESHGFFDAGVKTGQEGLRDEPLVASDLADSTHAIGSRDAPAGVPVRVCRKCSAQSRISGEFCPYCGARFTGKRIGRKANVAAAPTRATSARRLHPEDQPSGGMSRAQQIVLVIVGVLAVVGVGVGLFALTSDPSTAPLQRQVNVLKAVDASQHQQIASLQTEAASLKAATAGAATAGNMTALQTSVSGLSKTVVGVQGDISQLHTCLPELDQEVNTLGINTNTGSVLLNDGTSDTFLTSAYINNPTVISNNCTKFLTGQ
jgi:hypothetical protein